MNQEQVLDRWRDLESVAVGAIREYLATGRSETLGALRALRPAPSDGERWLLEDLLDVLADPPAWDAAAPRLLHILAALQRRGGQAPGHEPVALVGQWLGSRLRGEGPDEDWFTQVSAALDLSAEETLALAWWTQPGTAPRPTSADRFLLALPPEQLRSALSLRAVHFGRDLSPAYLLLARHAPHRLAEALRAAWPRVADFARPLVLALLLATGDLACAELAAELFARHRVRAAWPLLARRFADRFPPPADAATVVDELRRYRQLSAEILAAVTAYLETGERAHLAVVPQQPAIATMNISPLDDLASSLSLPGAPQSILDERILDILIHARAGATLARWLETAAAIEAPGENLCDAARALLGARGVTDDDLLTLLATQVGGCRGLRGVTSIGRHLLALSGDQLRDFAARQLAVYHSAGLHFLVVEAPERLAPLLEELGAAPRAGQAQRLRALLEAGLAAAPQRFEPLVLATAESPERLFTAEERPQKHMVVHIRGLRFDLLRALVKRDRQHAPPARACAMEILADRTDYRGTETLQWMIRTFGQAATDALLPLLASGSHLAHAVALQLASAFGRHAMPAIEWFLHGAPSSQLAGLRFLIALRDDRHAACVEQVLRPLLASSEVNVQVSAIGLGADWSFERVEERLWGLLQSKSKLVRGAAATTIATRRGRAAIERGAALLAHKQAAARLGAVSLLRAIGDPSMAELFEQRMEVEGSEEVRDELLLKLKEIWDRQGRTVTFADVERRIARTRARDDVAPWLDRRALPPLTLTDGQRLSPEAVRYLLHRQSRVRGVRVDIEAEALFALVDRRVSGDFALAVLEGFLDGGAATEESWVLVIAGLLGDERVVPRLAAGVRTWIKERRNVFAEYAVQALALQGSDAALLEVDALALRHATKPKNVGEAAAAAFAEAAERQDVTVGELRDRVVPWLGFQPGAPRVVDCAGKAIEVRVGADFALGLRDVNSGKLVRSLPKNASPGAAAELKELKELLKEAAKAQCLRLENLLVVGHRWGAARFRERFLQHPLLVPFAQRLIWVTHEADSGGRFTFRAREDGALVDSSGAEVRLSATAQVGMVHPLELDDEGRATWRDALARAAIDQPFAQLERPVLRLGPEQRDMDAFCDLVGRVASPSQIKGATERLSWRRGDTSGGMIADYWKAFPLARVIARLFLDGMPVALEMSTQACFGQLIFTPRDDPHQRLRLGDVPEIVLSETLADVQRISGVTLGEGQAA